MSEIERAPDFATRLRRDRRRSGHIQRWWELLRTSPKTTPETTATMIVDDYGWSWMAMDIA